jgi:hypothetical protein
MAAPLPRGPRVLADLILRPAEEPPVLHDFNRSRGIPDPLCMSDRGHTPLPRPWPWTCGGSIAAESVYRLCGRGRLPAMTQLPDVAAVDLVGRIVVLGLALSISACESSLTQTARGRGAIDLNCPAEFVSAYRVEGGAYVARGCERWITYTCLYAAGPVCSPQSEPHPHPTPGS